MPPPGQVNKDFLRQVFVGEKKLLKKKQVEYIHVSHYQELSVKNMWQDLKLDPDFKIYFQDEYPQDRLPSRSYFFDILNTTYPVYLAEVIKHAQNARNTLEGEDCKKHAIKVSDEWYDELQRMPFLSSK